jgi:hypothetical protein
MTPETKKALIIGAAVIGGAGLFAYIYSQRNVAGAVSAAVNAQSDQDEASLAELESVQGSGVGASLEPVGATTATSGSSDLATELAGIYQALGVTNPAQPAAPPIAPVTTTPAPVATPTPAPTPSTPSSTQGSTLAPLGQSIVPIINEDNPIIIRDSSGLIQ